MKRLTLNTRRVSAATAAAALAATAMSAVAIESRVRAQSPQTPAPAFEVASVKLNNSGDGRVMLSQQPGGRFTATNVPLRLLIRNAYQLQDFQITGGPSWIAEERFDIVAKAESGDQMGDPFRAEQSGQPSRGPLMIRALLAD